MPDNEMKHGESLNKVVTGRETSTSGLVDEVIARSLADERNLPEIEIDAALHGETVALANAVLDWVDAEEYRLTKTHGLIAGRKKYRPVKMLRDWARKHNAGRNRHNNLP